MIYILILFCYYVKQICMILELCISIIIFFSLPPFLFDFMRRHILCQFIPVASCFKSNVEAQYTLTIANKLNSKKLSQKEGGKEEKENLMIQHQRIIFIIDEMIACFHSLKFDVPLHSQQFSLASISCQKRYESAK